jgi:hypothetical protein
MGNRGKQMLEIYYDRERTKPCYPPYNGDYASVIKSTLFIYSGEYYLVNEDSDNPEKVVIYGHVKVYAYGEGVHIEAYGESCVTLFNGAVATLHDSSMLRLDHNDPNNGYSEGGFRVYRDLRDEGMVGSFMYQWGRDTMLCKYPKWAASPIWDYDWLWEHESHLEAAFRGGRQFLSYSGFEIKTVFEYESNEDIGFKVRLRDMTDQEKQAREKVNVKY